MIRKLRWKFVAVLMTIVTAFLLAIMVSIYLSAQSDYRRASLNTLNASTEGGAVPKGNTAVIVASVSFSGTITIQQNEISGISSDDVVKMIALVQESGASSGVLEQYGVRFLYREHGPSGEKYAFADMNFEKAQLKSQAINSTVIGASAFLIFFLVSVLLSRWMVRPVEEAWNKQKQFVADASHELKTPLTVALSNVEILIGSSPSSEKNMRRLDIARTELMRMKDLVEKLLTLMRADAGTTRAGAEPYGNVDFSYLAEGRASYFEPVFFEAGKTLESRVATGVTVWGDEARLRELTDILLDNACKYSAVGSTVTLVLEFGEKGRSHLFVTDEGAPIPQGELNNIFERFYRLDEPRGEIKGYGLGLSIALEIVKEHGGKIWAESDPTGKTTFHVVLPTRDGRANTAGK